MTQDVARLEDLLARVQRNAARPRGLAAAPAVAIAAPVYVPEPPAPEPVYVPEPAYVAPEPVYVPEFASEPPAPPMAAAPQLDSVDELLLEDPFPSVAPAPPPSYSDVFEEDPIPLVSVASVASERADLEDISGVVTVSELTEQQPEELLEDDIVEVSVEEAPQTALDDLDFDEEEELSAAAGNEEEPPASSSRKVAGSMDEALARAAEHIEMQEGREVPLKTPPPESGPQAAVALPHGIHAPLSPDIEELLEADIAPVGGVRSAVPTTEQLGQTIDLEEARGPELELDHPTQTELEPLQESLPNEELEVTLPQREFGGGYQENLMPPPEARQDLDAHLSRTGAAEHDEPIAPPPESLAQFPSQRPEAPTGGFAPVVVPSAMSTDSYTESVSTVTVDAPPNTEFAPELLARPDIAPGPVAKFIRAEAPRPSTFLELLDQSLGLGRD